MVRGGEVEKRNKRALIVLAVWLWMFIGSIATIALVACIKGVPLNLEGLVDMLNREPYLACYGEVVGVGALPLLISLARGDKLEMYGLRRQGALKSLAFSLSPAAVILVTRVIRGLSLKSFGLSFPYNIWYAALSVLAYGPLEAFFVVWLIVNTDAILDTLNKTASPGLFITVLVFGLSHVIFSPQGGFLNAVEVIIEFAVLGLIFKHTGNSLGPMVAWTLINGQVLHLLVGCLT